MNLHNTLNQLTEGLTAHCEYDLLPIYQDGELANAVAFRACQFKRFAQAAGHMTAEAAYNTAHAAARIAELTNQHLTHMANN